MQSPIAWDPRNAPKGSPEEERTSGNPNYLETLASIHRLLEPAFYLEIGVRHGNSLALARCPAIGVDPAPEIRIPALPATTRVVTRTSDDFFAMLETEPLPRAPDLAFIDGMHLYEYALRDFIHIEALATPTTLIVIDDIFPSHPAQAARERRTRVWTGDVWKLQRCLAQLRPGLVLLALDTAPTGLLLVAGLDPANRVLPTEYDRIVREQGDFDRDETVPQTVIGRTGVMAATDPIVARILLLLKQLRDQAASRLEVVAQLRAAIAGEPLP
jgi:hypothetical protein